MRTSRDNFFFHKIDSIRIYRWIVTRGAGPIDMLLQKEPTNYVIIGKRYSLTLTFGLQIQNNKKLMKVIESMNCLPGYFCYSF